jgi:hypothetical protein
MTELRKFRINAHDIVTDDVEFYFQVATVPNNAILCDFCVSDEGIWYYKRKSKILSRSENANSRGSVDGFISMVDLQALFTALGKAKLGNYDENSEQRLKITRSGNKVIIEAAPVVAEE